MDGIRRRPVERLTPGASPRSPVATALLAARERANREQANRRAALVGALVGGLACTAASWATAFVLL
jgi:hypothetical protein